MDLIALLIVDIAKTIWFVTRRMAIVTLDVKTGGIYLCVIKVRVNKVYAW